MEIEQKSDMFVLMNKVLKIHESYYFVKTIVI